CIGAVGNEVHSAFWTSAGFVADNFRMHRAAENSFGIELRQFFKVHSAYRTTSGFVVNFIAFAVHRAIIFSAGSMFLGWFGVMLMRLLVFGNLITTGGATKGLL